MDVFLPSKKRHVTHARMVVVHLGQLEDFAAVLSGCVPEAGSSSFPQQGHISRIISEMLYTCLDVIFRIQAATGQSPCGGAGARRWSWHWPTRRP